MFGPGYSQPSHLSSDLLSSRDPPGECSGGIGTGAIRTRALEPIRVGFLVSNAIYLERPLREAEPVSWTPPMAHPGLCPSRSLGFASPVGCVWPPTGIPMGPTRSPPIRLLGDLQWRACAPADFEISTVKHAAPLLYWQVLSNAGLVSWSLRWPLCLTGCLGPLSRHPAGQVGLIAATHRSQAIGFSASRSRSWYCSIAVVGMRS